MENSQTIALVAIAISLVALVLSFIVPITLQSDIRNLNNDLISQSDEIKSLINDLNGNSQIIKSQNIMIDGLRIQQNSSQTQINNLQTNITNMENQINSLNNRVTTLEQRSQPQCMIPEGCPPVQKLPQPPKLIGWWPADGNASDVVGGHNGILSGDVTFGLGRTGQAFNFDGNSSVSLGSLGIDSDTEPYSVIVWINPSASAINDGLTHTIVAQGSTANGFGNGQYFNHFSLFGKDGLGVLEVEIGATQTYSQLESTLPVISPNQWSLVTVTYDGSRTSTGIKIYVNDMEQTTTLRGSGFTSYGSPRDGWIIGSEIGGFDPFTGLIDNVKVFSCTLPQSDIHEEFLAHDLIKC